MTETAIDHLGITVTDYEGAKAFYLAALKPLGVGLEMEFPGHDGGMHCGIGLKGKPFFWLTGGDKTEPHIHLALVAPNRAAVHAFYEAAMAAGGTDNGPPGPRPHYHPGYYAAFVLDPDGHNIEVVTHKPE